MAPSYSDDDQESQILPWAGQSTMPSQEQDLEVQPSFMHFKPGQPFGFRLPSQTTTTSTGGTQSIRSYNSSLWSSSNPSIFSAPISRGSSAASSCSMSECRSNSAYQKQGDWEGSQLAPPKWLSQLCMFAMAKNHTSDAPQRNSHIHTPSSHLSSGTQDPVCDDDPPSPPPMTCGATLNPIVFSAPFNHSRIAHHIHQEHQRWSRLRWRQSGN